jgi:hypothetical protein
MVCIITTKEVESMRFRDEVDQAVRELDQAVRELEKETVELAEHEVRLCAEMIETAEGEITYLQSFIDKLKKDKFALNGRAERLRSRWLKKYGELKES